MLKAYSSKFSTRNGATTRNDDYDMNEIRESFHSNGETVEQWADKANGRFGTIFL